MKYSGLGLALALGATMVQPGDANIGRAASLFCELFCGGLADLFVNIFGKRSVAMGMKGDLLPRYPQGQAPPGVPQFEYERCYHDMAGLTILATSPRTGSVQFDNVPPTCMNLATVLIGNPVDGPYPIPCGSACLVYNDLTQDQFNQLVSIMHSVA